MSEIDAPTPPVQPKSHLWIIISLIAVIVLLVGLLMAVILERNQIIQFSNPFSLSNLTPPSTTTSQTNQTTATTQPPLFSGQTKRLTENLMLFKITETDTLNGIENDFAYYSAGTFTRGELKGYTRIIALRPPEGPGSPVTYTLATKDYQKYLLDDPKGLTTKYPEDNWQNPYSMLDKQKISGTAVFDTEQPSQLDLDGQYALFYETLPTQTVPVSANSQTYETVLTTDLTQLTKLTASTSELTMYFKPREPNTALLVSSNSQQEKDDELIKQKYMLSKTEAYVVDSAGLPALYALTTPENIVTYGQEKAQYDIAWQQYMDASKAYDATQGGAFPQSPAYVYPPNLGFTKAQVTNDKKIALYNDYRIAIPEACANSLNTNVMAVTDTDLEPIGSVSDIQLYRLKDKQHPLYELAYNNKTEYYQLDPTAWDAVNKGMKQPTLSEYVASTPLLFMKDNWQRWVAVGEYDIKLPGGCGKPVIYLYPPQPMKVSVQFQSPVHFTVEIPTYEGGWEVLAHPDGSLVNLKAAATHCQSLDTSSHGSEYAREACETNTYPYLYWAGSVDSQDYPAITKGWIVQRSQVGEFLRSTVSAAGLNEQETNDFVSYWLPVMLAKNGQYYRISFLQTQDLNRIFPMTVIPKPDTTYRLFVDFSALSDKPAASLPPQTLDKLTRRGFTLVEWGGLKH